MPARPVAKPRPAAFAIKAAVEDQNAQSFVFLQQKTMYRGREIAAGDIIYLFASETQGGHGLFARGQVVKADAVARAADAVGQTPRVSIEVMRSGTATAALGRDQLRSFRDSGSNAACAELDFKLYRQATNKIIGVSEEAATFLGVLFIGSCGPEPTTEALSLCSPCASSKSKRE